MDGKQLLSFFQANGISLFVGGKEMSKETALFFYLETAARLPETLKIPLDSIVAVESSFRAPQNLFDHSMGDLAASLAKQGMQVPIKVRRTVPKIVPEVGARIVSEMAAFGIPVPVQRVEQYTLVHGFRRLIVARCLGWKEIDAEVLAEK